MVTSVLLCLTAQAILSIASAYDIDSRFSVDDRKLQFDELTKTVQDLNTAVMGIAEIVVEINKNVQSVHTAVLQTHRTVPRKGAGATGNGNLAGKIEKLLAMKDKPRVEVAKEEIKQQIEYNFLRTLSVILATGPVRAQERQNDILKLMQSTLNGELDFAPIVEKLPFLARQDETNRFISLLKYIRENERRGSSPSRQPGRQQNVDKILDAASKINLKEVGNFLKEIPEIFQGVESIIDSVDEYFR